MGNNVSSPPDVIKEEILIVMKEEQVSDTNNCNSSDDSSSCASYTEFHDALQYLSSSPQNHQRRRWNTLEDWNECFRLPIFQKRQGPLRMLQVDSEGVYRDDDDKDNNEDHDDLSNNRNNILSSSCWPKNSSASSLRRRSSSRRSSYKSSSSSSRNSGNGMETKLDDTVNFEETDVYDSQEPNYDNDTSEDEEEYTCSPAAYLYNRSSSKSSPVTTTTEPISSALETSTRRFYYCYPSASTSSLSRCKSAISQTSSSLPLFLDERNIDWEYTQEELDMFDGDEPTEASNLRLPRRYWIVTTAALPWMTGTAVNPLLRAAYLSQRNRRLMQEEQRCEETQPEDDDESFDTSANSTVTSSTVTLVLPWLEDPGDREKLYGPAWALPDKSCDDQEAYIRQWLATSAHLPLEAAPPSEGGIAIQWYPARYHAALSSIFALGDLCEMIPTSPDETYQEATTRSQKSNMICILEEPEHVNFYRAPGRESWRDRFGHVIGIVHTNYKAYAQNHYSGILTGPLVGALSSLMVRAYCDKVVKLSPVLQTYAPGKEVISNVHGIRQEFFRVPLASPAAVSSTRAQCYFIGKLLWAKGMDKLLNLEAHFRKKTGKYFDIDIVGSGPEQTEIERSFLGMQQNRNEARDVRSSTHSKEKNPIHWRYFRQPIPARFLGRRDHAEVGPNYSIFVNPSITEVLCTTTAEAIAMGKWVIIPRHASNEFFLQFPNCLQYKNKNEFVDLLQYALTNPVKDVLERCKNNLSNRSQFYAPLTWEVATERLIDCAYLSKREARRRDRLTLHKEDRSIQEWHYTLGNGKSGDVLRKVLGGGPVAEQSTYKKLSSNLSASSSVPSLIVAT
ncbi:hypothetical protein IV203_031092 [Nitzschia inconspicua]|uniref:Digalactosyldiacylglycerol synthase n=1 Tax=Nitzschia inconspicua TaxID=303405 RepID=A0A9K3LUP2_9STRA|nr:hypothetical protein IV203_031092 [Nitzschia inconspicua]